MLADMMLRDAFRALFCNKRDASLILIHHFQKQSILNRLSVAIIHYLIIRIQSDMGRRKKVVLPMDYDVTADKKLHEKVPRVMLKRIDHDQEKPKSRSCTIDKYFGTLEKDHHKDNTPLDSHKALEKERDLSILLGEKILILEEELCKKNARIKFLEDQLKYSERRESETKSDIASEIESFMSELQHMRESNLSETSPKTKKVLDLNPGSPDLKSNCRSETKLATRKEGSIFCKWFWIIT